MPTAKPAGVAPVPDTEELLRRAELKAQEHHDAWLRAKAEAENIRKRTATELANAYKYAIERHSRPIPLRSKR
jgi:molecular chaperone GrpE